MRVRVTQDRRQISRIGTRLACSFLYEGVQHKAVALDISLNGALLSSKAVPATGKLVTLNIKLPLAKDKIEVQGKVMRRVWGFSDHGQVGKFGIQFSHTPPDIFKFIASPKS
jgi:hypothetical protein